MFCGKNCLLKRSLIIGISVLLNVSVHSYKREFRLQNKMLENSLSYVLVAVIKPLQSNIIYSYRKVWEIWQVKIYNLTPLCWQQSKPLSKMPWKTECTVKRGRQAQGYSAGSHPEHREAIGFTVARKM